MLPLGAVADLDDLVAVEPFFGGVDAVDVNGQPFGDFGDGVPVPVYHFAVEFILFAVDLGRVGQADFVEHGGYVVHGAGEDGEG